MASRHKKDPTKFPNIDMYPNVNGADYEHSIFSKHIGKYPYISITYGIRIELSNYDEFAHIKFIVDPILFMMSRSKDFDPDTYDYLQIMPIDDYMFIKRFVGKFFDFLTIQRIPDYVIAQICLTRADFCANISIKGRFNLKKYFQYMRILPKYLRFNDKNQYKGIDTGDECQCLQRSKYQNMVKFGNGCHIITMYDKIAEQRDHFNRKFKDNRLLRIEYQVLNSKIKTIAENAISDGYFGEEYKLWHNPDSFGTNLVDDLWLLANISPYAILNAICMTFPDATIRSRTATFKKISKIECGKKTKNAMYEFVDMMSKSTSHSDMKERIRSFKGMYGDNCYYRVIHLLEENDIAPIYMSDDDVRSLSATSLPSVRDIFLSAIKNDIEENHKLD